MSDAPLRVIVVDDHELVRSGLRSVLDTDDGLEVVAEASDGLQAIAAVEMHQPDVVVMDLQMPGMGGIEATRRIVAARPGTAVLVLTMFDDDESVFAAVRAGARGYLLKGARRDELRSAVRGVHIGQAVFGLGVAAKVLERMTGGGGRSTVFPELTPREHEVLGHLVDGLQPAAIARRMTIAEKTVRNNISSLLTKLHVEDRAAAVELARGAGVGSRTAATVRYLVFTGSTGGSHVAAFADASAALDAALEARATTLRIGIHRGEVTAHGDELLGIAVEEAARVAYQAADGQILISEEAVPQDLPSGTRVVDIGVHELRDVDRELRLFAVETQATGR